MPCEVYVHAPCMHVHVLRDCKIEKESKDCMHVCYGQDKESTRMHARVLCMHGPLVVKPREDKREPSRACMFLLGRTSLRSLIFFKSKTNIDCVRLCLDGTEPYLVP